MKVLPYNVFQELEPRLVKQQQTDIFQWLLAVLQLKKNPHEPKLFFPIDHMSNYIENTGRCIISLGTCLLAMVTKQAGYPLMHSRSADQYVQNGNASVCEYISKCIQFNHFLPPAINI